MNLSLQNTDSSAPFVRSNVEVSGQIEDAIDSNGNHPYRVLFGQPVQANQGISYARIAIGDNAGCGAAGAGEIGNSLVIAGNAVVEI